jgi:hypothetical protein
MAFFCLRARPIGHFISGYYCRNRRVGRSSRSTTADDADPQTPAGYPWYCSLALIANLQNTDAAAGMTKEMADDGTITDREGYFRHLPDQRQRHYYQLLLIRCCAVYQYHGSGDYSLVVILIFKFIGANFLRLWIAGLKTDS